MILPVCVSADLHRPACLPQWAGRRAYRQAQLSAALLVVWGFCSLLLIVVDQSLISFSILSSLINQKMTIR